MESQEQYEHLRRNIYEEIPNQDAAVKRVQAYKNAAKIAKSYNRYDLAYHCFRSIAETFSKKRLEFLARQYWVLAGDAIYQEGGWLDYQRAADCYALAGEKGLLKNIFQELHYSREDITPSSWMGMAKCLADINCRETKHGN